MATDQSKTRSARKTLATPKQHHRRQAKSDANKREAGGIQSIERAISIVDLVARHPDGISLAELSSELELNNTTVFHLVKTLDKLDIVAQVAETKRYRIGSHLFALAAGALNDSTLLALATPILEQLSTDTGEAANLTVRSHHEIIVIASTAAAGMLQLSGGTGTTRPAHATATGKALLSAMPQFDLDQLLDARPLDALTPSTITNRKALAKELREIRKTGIAYDRGEFDADVTCAAVLVSDFAGRYVGAIGISGPVWRMTPKLLQQKAKYLRNAAAQLSAQLGFNDDTCER